MSSNLAGVYVITGETPRPAGDFRPMNPKAMPIKLNIDFFDLMPILYGPYMASFAMDVNQSGWKDAGLYPFTWKPYWDLRADECWVTLNEARMREAICAAITPAFAAREMGKGDDSSDEKSDGEEGGQDEEHGQQQQQQPEKQVAEPVPVPVPVPVLLSHLCLCLYLCLYCSATCACACTCACTAHAPCACACTTEPPVHVPAHVPVRCACTAEPIF